MKGGGGSLHAVRARAGDAMTRLHKVRASRRSTSRIRSRRGGVVGVALALAAGLGAYTLPGAAAGTSPGGGGPRALLLVTGNQPGPGATRPTAAPRLPRSSVVTLITGQRVRLDVLPDGRQNANVLPSAAGPGATPHPSTFIEFTWGGDEYVVPDPAVPYLGSTLDPRLFDVSYLARARLDDAHASALPVAIGFTGAARPILPGVHVSSVSGRSASATIAKALAGQLGQMLADRWRSARSGHSPVPAGRLPGVARISLAPPRGSPPLPPVPSMSAPRTGGHPVPFRTLRLKFTGLDGRPAAAVGFVQDVKNARLALFVASGRGSEKLSVPQGIYSIEFSVLTPHPSDAGFDTALVVKPQFTVASDVTVRLDAQAARPLRVSVHGIVTPPVQENVLDYLRSSQTGGEVGLGGFDFLALRLVSVSPDPEPGIVASKLLASPTRRVTKGNFGFDAYSFLSPRTLGTEMKSARPTYFLAFSTVDRIPASLTYRVPAANLTAVHEHLYAPPGTPPANCGLHGAQAGPVDTVYQPWDNNSFQLGAEVPLGNRTDYWYSSAPRLDWWQAAYNGCDFVRRWGPIQQIRPGEQISQTWLKGPVVPSPAAPPVNAAAAVGAFTLSPDAPAARADGAGKARKLLRTVCAACRQDDNGMLYLLPFGDSDPAHYAEEFAGISRVRFYRNGRLALTSAAMVDRQLNPFALNLAMLTRPATYRLDWFQTQPGNRGAHTDTDWTFRSGPGGARRPAATEECAPDPTRGCSLLPLLFINYNLALNFDSQAKADQPFRIAFTVGHQQDETAPSGLSATVSASYDDGKTWTRPRAAAGHGGGNFSATIDQPPLSATSGFVSLRVTARDQAGNAVTQTIIRAYGLHG